MLTVPQGSFTLRRLHTPNRSPLRAWSAADEMALRDLADLDSGETVLVLNDAWGALSVGLAQHAPTVWSDSALARDAIDANLKENDLEPLGPRAVRGNEIPVGSFSVAVVVVPKSHVLLRWQLAAIWPLLAPDARVLGVAMARHVNKAVVGAFRASIGEPTPRLAERKARLIDVSVADHDGGSEPMVRYAFRTDDDLAVWESPGVFSARHLDVGTALLLEELATAGPNGEELELPDRPQVADLGCGNGVVAATLAKRWPRAAFALFDVSDLAIEAARATWSANELGGHRMKSHVCDGFGSTKDDSFDLVITNPPFHQEHAVDRDLTDRLLAETARVVRPSGSVIVVAQRHLHLHTRMLKWFESVEVVSGHPSHVVLLASGVVTR